MTKIELIITERVRSHEPEVNCSPHSLTHYCNVLISNLVWRLRRDGGYITFCPSNGECSEKCKDCWQKAIDNLKEEGEPIL